MTDPKREEARSKTDRELIVEHDDIIFGGWGGTRIHPRRTRGLLERLNSIEFVLKGLGVPLAVLALKALGVPTEEIGRIIINILTAVGKGFIAQVS